MSGMDKIPIQDENENALEGDTDLDITIITLGELNELKYEHLILSINSSSSVGKVTFGLVRVAKSSDFSKGNCKIMRCMLVSKYAHTQHHNC